MTRFAEIGRYADRDPREMIKVSVDNSTTLSHTRLTMHRTFDMYHRLILN